MNKLFGLVVIVVLLAVMIGFFFAEYAMAPQTDTVLPEEDTVMCTMDAMQCPDGSYVGRTGPNCQFVCPPLPTVPADVQAQIDAHADLITVASPLAGGLIESGVTISGQARGGWYFEASFPVTLVNWDGLIIAEGPATATSDWMTPEFVPFTMNLPFTNPYTPGDPEFMKKGTLIFKKDNPSGLPENDDAVEIPVRFAP